MSTKLLLLAAAEGDVEVVGRALLAGADVHASDDQALRVAARKGHSDVVRLLLHHHADIHAREDEALWWSLVYRRVDVALLLIRCGASMSLEAAQQVYDEVLNGCLAPVVLESALDRPGCMHGDVAGVLRERILATPSPSPLDALASRLRLDEASAALNASSPTMEPP